MDRSALAITRMNSGHVQAVVSVHLLTFRGFFLTQLGARFLRQLYLGILRDASGLAFVATDQDAVVGFVAGSTGAAGLYRRLLRRSALRFAWAAALPVIREPRILPRMVRSLGKPREAASLEGGTLLMSLGVHPEYSGRGIGQKLVNTFIDAAEQQGTAFIALTTDAETNERTNRFYQDLGFQLERRFQTAEGRWLNEYRKQTGRSETRH